MTLVALATAFLALLGLAPISIVSAETVDPNNFTIDSFHADYRLALDDDGHAVLHTVETITARFPDFDQNRGLQRAIPHAYDGHPVDLEVLSVTDETGAARAMSVANEGALTVVTSAVPAGEYVHGVQTYVFTYTQRDVMKVADDTDALEWYWDVNGDDWWQPIEQVSAIVQFDADLSQSFTGAIACYVGAYGSTQPCPTAEVISNATAEGEITLRFAAHGLADREGLTVAVGFTPGSVTLYTEPFLQRTGALIWSAVIALVGAIVTSVWSAVRRMRGHRTGNPIIAHYDPPADTPVALAASIAGNNAAALPATLLDLAVRGNVRMLRSERGRFGVQYRHANNTHDMERTLLKTLFTSADISVPGSGVVDEAGVVEGATLWFTDDHTTLTRAATQLTASARAESDRRKLRRPQTTGGSPWTAVLLSIAVIAGVAQLWLVEGGSILSVINPAIMFIAFVVFFIVRAALAVSRRFQPLTEQGALMRDHLMGLRDYIELAEADRIRMLQSASGAEVSSNAIVHLYERLLPYAVIFRHEREWQRELAQYYGDARPDWYWSGDGSDVSAPPVHLFTQSVRSASTPASTSPGSSWSSSSTSFSSSGGSSGGGFSGGGGGGGGGRGI